MTSFAKYGRFASIDARKNTFRTWNNPYLKSQDLIDNGFFYVGISDRVQCYYCGMILHSFEATDDVAAEHWYHNPNCALAKNNMRWNSILAVIDKLKQKIQNGTEFNVLSSYKMDNLLTRYDNMML